MIVCIELGTKMSQTTKICNVCKIEKPLESFSVREISADGYRNNCKECKNAQQNAYIYTLEGAITQLLGHARARSKILSAKDRREFDEFSITREILQDLWNNQNGLCYYSGVPMAFHKNEWRVSLERLHPSTGYVENNVALTCLELNSLSQWSHNKIIEMIGLIGQKTKYTRNDFYPIPNKKTKPKKVVPIERDGETFYQCHICDELKAASFYSPNRLYMCKTCKNASSKAHRETPLGALKKMISRAKSHMTRRNSTRNVRDGEFEIDYDFLVSVWEQQKGLCYYSDIPMVFEGTYKDTNWKCSIERKDPRRNYTKDNVCLICVEFNSIDHTVSYKKENQGSSGWTKEKFQYFLQHAKAKFDI
jgi:hypothetical protein